MVSIFDFPIETFIQGHIINEDGTIFDPPENPLLKKWKEKYPARSEPNNSQVCDGYSCTFCSRCPSGDGWEVPEEDRAEYDI